jgi:cytosine/adenosine deaminase-related metal-dependent hydrolase
MALQAELSGRLTESAQALAKTIAEFRRADPEITEAHVSRTCALYHGFIQPHTQAQHAPTPLHRAQAVRLAQYRGIASALCPISELLF